MELKLDAISPLERYKLLIGLVIPRPIAWISTVNEAGVNNCAPFSFFNVLCEEPPLVVTSFNTRSDGHTKHTLKNNCTTRQRFDLPGGLATLPPNN